jgi:hypothetical protein
MNTAIRYAALGYQQLTSISASTGLTVPAGADLVVLSIEAQGVRYRDDGTAPTAAIGMLLPSGSVFEYTGNIGALRFIQATAGAIVNAAYYSQSG